MILNIVQIAAHYPPHLGGMENCVQEISYRLAKKGHQVEVFASNDSCQKEKVEAIKNLNVHLLRYFMIANTPIIPSLFIKLLKVPRNSIIHLHVAQAFIPEIVWLVSKIRNISYIANLHLDVSSSGIFGFLLPFYKKLFLENILKSASKIVVPTKDYASLISQKYHLSKKKICVIPAGVDLDKFKHATRKCITPHKLLFVGRLTIQKNIPLLIQSFKKVANNGYSDLTLNIVGEGEDINKIANLIKKENLEDKIVLHNVLRGKKLYQMYANSDIFILTSREESFGIVLIEAMASGLPIIASDIPGIRNVIKNGETGLLVKPTVDNFANAIKEMVDNHDLKNKLIKNGLREVKKYDWGKIVEKFEAVYQEIQHEAN